MLDARRDLAAEPLLRDWAMRGRPLIARRRLPTDGDGLWLGLPLPPAAGKRRIALEFEAADVVSVGPLPRLSQVIGTAPAAWRPHLQALEALAGAYQIHAGVYGSLAWQWLTGLEYLGPRSDVDIAWTLPRAARVERFLVDLAAADARSPVRLDGEVLRADGAGVNWRELLAGGAELALKTATAVLLQPRAAFVGGVP